MYLSRTCLNYHLKIMNNTTFPTTEGRDFNGISAERTFVIAIMVSIDVFVVFTNIFMICVISRATKLRKLQASLFVVNLCVLNLLAGGTILPKSITVYVDESWPWDHNTCVANGFLNTFFSFASIFAICVITVEKFYCILFPMHHAGNMTVYKTAILIILTWALAIVLASLPIFGWNAYEFNKYSGCCWPGWRRNVKSRALMIFNLTFMFMLPAILIAVINVKLYKVAKQAAAQVHPITEIPLSGRTAPRKERIPVESICRISAIHCDSCCVYSDDRKCTPAVNMADQGINLIVQPIREAQTSTRDNGVTVVRPVPTDQHSSPIAYRDQFQKIRGNFKAFKTLLLSFASFITLWGPYFILQAYIVMNDLKEGRHIVAGVAKWLSYVSYAVNPLVYGCVHSEIRHECNLALQRLCCKKEAEDNTVTSVSQINESREDFFQFLDRTCSAGK